MGKSVEVRLVGSGYKLNTPNDREFAFFEALMKQVPGQTRDECNGCRDCPYYHPEWEHRICLFTKCKYGKAINVFRKKGR